MTARAPLLTVSYREVRHFEPDDCLHYERLEKRGRLHRWLIPSHRHEALYQFQLLERGSVTATVDGTLSRLTAPAAWMIAPDTLHGFAFAPGSTGHAVTVPAEILQGLLVQTAGKSTLLQRSFILRRNAMGPALGELRNLFRAIARESDAMERGRYDALRALASLLGLWFLRHDMSAGGARPDMRDPLVERFRELIDRHFSAHWTVADYARTLRVTSDHLSRRCRALTGLSARDLIYDRLVLEARRHLIGTPVPVADIGYRLGFNDPGHFSRLFARRTGQTPSAYRRSLADGTAMHIPDLHA
jgi:AraC family transcriptional regulator, transcriptional activator of pobA